MVSWLLPRLFSISYCILATKKQNLHWRNAKGRRVLAGSQRPCSSALLCHSWLAEGSREHISRGCRDLCRHFTPSYIFLHSTVLPHFIWNHGEALRSVGEEPVACESQGHRGNQGRWCVSLVGRGGGFLRSKVWMRQGAIDF